MPISLAVGCGRSMDDQYRGTVGRLAITPIVFVDVGGVMRRSAVSLGDTRIETVSPGQDGWPS